MSGGSSPHNRPNARAAPIATRPMATHTNGSNIAAPRPSRLPASPATLRSRPGQASRQDEPARRLQQACNTAAAAAAPIAARPNMRGRAVQEVGFDNWAIRHESIAALPALPRARPSRVPSVIREEDDSQPLSALLSPAAKLRASENQQPATLR